MSRGPKSWKTSQSTSPFPGNLASDKRHVRHYHHRVAILRRLSIHEELPMSIV